MSIISRIVVIYGPTASGKSGVAIELAKKFNGEIISADSRQIFKKMDIGTGKVSNDEFKIISSFFRRLKIPFRKQKEGFFSEGVRHHLIDIAQPLEDYNISHFKKDATLAIEDILKRKKLPIICGGTNFWIDSIVHDSQIPEVAPDEKLRNLLRNKTEAELFEKLQQLDPARAADIDPKNKVRLIRAIEICKALGSVPKPTIQNLNPNYEFLQIGIATERDQLNAKIKKRLDDRFKEGMIEEVDFLQKDGVSFEWLERIGLEYRWISRFLQNKVSEQEMQEKLYFDIIHYAKRQMTWLKRNPNIIWLKKHSAIKKEVKKFLQKKI